MSTQALRAPEAEGLGFTPPRRVRRTWPVLIKTGRVGMHVGGSRLTPIGSVVDKRGS
jgi:hypothetical protein